MNDRESFLASIAAAPHDPVLRGVYADWLEERDGANPCIGCSGKGWRYDGHDYNRTRETCGRCDGKGRVANGYAAEAERQRERAALLRVLLRPDAPQSGSLREGDAPRLDYAAWLEANAGTVVCGRCDGKGRHPHTDYDECQPCVACGGEGVVPDGRNTRAEFIRAQCRVAATEVYPGERFCAIANARLIDSADDCTECDPCRLRRRERELLADHGGVIAAGIAGVFGSDRYRVNYGREGLANVRWSWRRGFVESVTLPWSAHEHLDALLEEHPVRVVRLTSTPTCDSDCGVVGEGYHKIGGVVVEGAEGEDWPAILPRRWPGTAHRYDPTIPPVKFVLPGE